jgi:hypothetical protein
MPALASIFNSHQQSVSNKIATWADIKSMCSTPILFDSEISEQKDSDGELISNKYMLSCIAAHDCKLKTKQAITQHNSMSWLRVDSDENYYSINELAKALASIGINTFVIHTSWSSKKDFNKLKCLIPLATPIDLATWQNLQERVTEALHTDPCMNNMTQISYAPATYPGHCYEHYIHEAGHHNFDLLPQLKPKPVIQKRESISYEGDSLIKEYNSRFDWDFELTAHGYKKKGKRWLSPTATSKIPGGSIFTGDDGKLLFHTHHTSDPIHKLGAVDGFGFACVMAGKSARDMVIELANGELKEWNQKKQKAFVEGKEQEQVLNDDDFAKFSAIFAKKTDAESNIHPFFGNIKAPVDGHYTMPTELTPQQQSVKKIISKPQFSDKSQLVDVGTPSWVFPTPVDESINIFTAPGLVGECIKYINSTGRRPRPTLAIGAALAAMGVVGGISHEDVDFGATSNLFCFNVAGSGSGKEAVLQSISKIISESGFKGCVFGKIKSEQEIYRSLIHSQVACYNIDEIGEVLGKITGSTETYMTGVIGALMDIYSSASSIMNLGFDEQQDIKEKVTKTVSMLQKKIEDNEDADVSQQIIDSLKPFLEDIETGFLRAPFLTVSGCTTPLKFTKLATPDYVLNGFIGRSLIFRENEDAPRKDYYFKKQPFPPNLSHELKKIKNCGTQKNIEFGRTQNYGDKVAVKTTQEAQEWLRALDYNIDTEAIEHVSTTGMQALINRKQELILKVSFILAIGDGKVRTLEHVKWAQKLVDRDISTKINLVIDGSDPEEGQTGVDRISDLTQKVIKVMRRKAIDLLPSVIAGDIRGYNSKDVEKVLLVLISQGVVNVVERKGKKNRYILSDLS